MSEKKLKINFRYLTGNIACMSVDSVNGEPVHNDINNEEAIILFNSLVGEKEGCRTLKTLLKEIQQLKGVIETYEIIIKSTNALNWHELKNWLKEQILHFQFAGDFGEWNTNIEDLEMVLDKMQELENRKV